MRKRWNKLDERDEKRESDGGVVRPKPVRRAFFLQLPTGEKKRRQRRRDETRTGRVFLFLSEPVEVEERDDDDDDDDVSRRRRRRVSRKIFERKEREGMVARDDEDNVMTAAARVLVERGAIHVERDCAVLLYLERNGERRLVEDVIFAEVLDIFEPRFFFFATGF